MPEVVALPVAFGTGPGNSSGGTNPASPQPTYTGGGLNVPLEPTNGPIQTSRFEQNFYNNNPAQTQTGSTGQTPTQQPTQTPQVQTTPFIGTEGMFKGQYYGTTAQPMTWQIQPNGEYVEAHGVGGGDTKTLAEIAAMGGLSQVYVGMELKTLGEAYQHYNQPTALEAYQQQLQAQQQQPQQYDRDGASPYASYPGQSNYASEYSPGNPAIYGDAFSQQLYDYDPGRAQAQNEIQGIMNDRLYNPSAYGSGYATLGNTGQKDSNTSLYGAIIGAANAAGNMINTAFGGSPTLGSQGAYNVTDAMFRNSLTSASQGANMDVTKQNYQGTPYYQLNQGASINIPSSVQTELDMQKAYIEAQRTGNMSAYMGQYGRQPNTMAITSYIRNPPPELQEAARQYMLQANAANAQARLAVNPNDVVGNAILSNKHISNQALNQSGAGSTILFPDGDQKGRLLRSIPGVNVDPALLAWADTADYLTNQLYPQGIQAGVISPSYQSEGMGNASAATNGYAYTGTGAAANEWIPGLHGLDNPVFWGQPNSGLPDWMQPNPSPFTNNAGGQVNAIPGYQTQVTGSIVGKNGVPLNGMPGAEPSHSGLPSGWASLGADSTGHTNPGGVVLGNGTIQGYGQSPLGYQGQTGWDRNGNPIFGGTYYGL